MHSTKRFLSPPFIYFYLLFETYCLYYDQKQLIDTSLSAQIADLNSGVTESNGVNSSVYVFTRIRVLYRIDNKL